MPVLISSWFTYVGITVLCEERVLGSRVDIPQTPAAAPLKPDSLRRCIEVPAAGATWSAGQCDNKARHF